MALLRLQKPSVRRLGFSFGTIARRRAGRAQYHRQFDAMSNAHEKLLRVHKPRNPVTIPMRYNRDEIFRRSNKPLFNVVSTFAGGGGSSSLLGGGGGSAGANFDPWVS